MYKLQDMKLPSVFESLSYFVVAALDIINPEFTNESVVGLEKQEKVV